MIIDAYKSTFSQNKLILAAVLSIQVLGGILLLLIASAFATITGMADYSVTVDLGSGVSFSEIANKSNTLITDVRVINVVMTVDDGTLASVDSVSTSNFFDETIANNANGRWIILPKEAAEDFAYGDSVSLWGVEYAVCGFNRGTYKEISIATLSESATITKIIIYCNSDKRSVSTIADFCRQNFQSAVVTDSGSVGLSDFFDSLPLAALSLSVLTLLDVFALFLCYKYYASNLRTVNEVLFAVGTNPQKTRALLLGIFAALFILCFSLSIGIYYAIDALTASSLESTFSLSVYTLRFGDTALLAAVYLLTAVVFLLIYYTTKKIRERKL